MNRKLLLVLFFFLSRTYIASAECFFCIESIKMISKEPTDTVAVWKTDKITSKQFFSPSLEVKIKTHENIRADQTKIVAHFFDERDTPIVSLDLPSPAGKSSGQLITTPVLFYKDKVDRVFFEVPNTLPEKWKAVIVFGDGNEAISACYPPTVTDFLLNYPEKSLVYDRSIKHIERKVTLDPLIESVVKTKNPAQPQITLFFRPPKGVTEIKDVQGIMAICILAGSVAEIRSSLQKQEMGGDYLGVLKFANEHKLAILAWGSVGFWDPTKNNEDLSRAAASDLDKKFDYVSDAWERGVLDLAKKYNFDANNMLLWGISGSAQWAARLCLRKPNYFLAINIHVPSSFDTPTPEAAKVMWCLTTGELEPGYERSKRFLIECERMGYPIMYKAIVGLGHAAHPDATEMGFKFFEYALTQKAMREKHDKLSAANGAANLNETLKPWPENFNSPPYYGDIINQEVYPSSDVEMIPSAFRVPLPTEEIKNVWARNPSNAKSLP